MQARAEDYEKIIARLRASFTKEGILKARAIEARLMNETWSLPHGMRLSRGVALRSVANTAVESEGHHAEYVHARRAKMSIAFIALKLHQPAARRNLAGNDERVSDI